MSPILDMSTHEDCSLINWKKHPPCCKLIPVVIVLSLPGDSVARICVQPPAVLRDDLPGDGRQ